MITFSQLISRLGGVARVSKSLNLKYGTVNAMYRRDRVPPEYADQLVALAAKQGKTEYTAGYILAMYSDLRNKKLKS